MPQASGGKRLKLQGKTVVTFGLTPEECALIDRAAALKRWPRATFIRYTAIDEAKKLLEQLPKF